ncbi:MAG: M14 family metallopeptidase [Oscillospiraceae bacterium]
MIQTIAKASLAVNEDLVIQKNTIRHGSGSKRLCLVTGIHGDELEGQYLAWLLAKTLNDNLDKLNGTVDIYPAMNPMGIDSITRGVPMFDLDMNRIFPGSKDGTMIEALCASIVDDLSGADMCIDVHASNIYLKEIPQIRINVNSADELVPYAKMLNVDFIWVHEAATVLESTLAYSLNSIGTKTLVCEMGVGMRITKEYSFQLLDGILNLMKNLGMWNGEVNHVREPMTSIGRSVGFVNSAAAGVFVPCVEFGENVKQGDHIGDVLDPLKGTVAEEVLAVCDGMIFTLREYPIVFGGSLLARILQPEGKGDSV